MITRGCVYLIPVAVLAACAGGTTMRVAQEDDTTDYGPVALAPEPETAPDSAAAPVPAPETAYDPAAPAEGAEPVQQGQDSGSQGYAPYDDVTTPAVRRIGQWTRTGINEARRLVIRNANEWAAFWSELGVGERPDVDFTRDMVVAVAAGQQPSGGFEIAVERVSQSTGQLTIEVLQTTPGPNCMTASALTQPVDVVVIPKLNARGWSFAERKVVRGCQ